MDEFSPCFVWPLMIDLMTVLSDVFLNGMVLLLLSADAILWDGK